MRHPVTANVCWLLHGERLQALAWRTPLLQHHGERHFLLVLVTYALRLRRAKRPRRRQGVPEGGGKGVVDLVAAHSAGHLNDLVAAKVLRGLQRDVAVAV